MSEALEVLKNRVSTRAYQETLIPEDTLEQIVEAGLHAASGMGRQAVKLVVITDRETRDTLSKMNASIMGVDSDPFYGAPELILVLADKSVPTSVYDGALVMGNLMNAAHALGVGSCWIHRAKEEFESEEGKALLAKWGIEGDFEGIGHCILGVPKDGLGQPKPIKEGRVVRV